ncbi:alpha/beta hydrolase [Capnocytophaga sp. ARDL2]|uniref:alpha/beta hydrolase n=1 Tax=Capnocytophaga sp. ARDL2 TaxID=3238809 RepID=UPI0035570428
MSLHYILKKPKTIKEKNPLLLLLHGFGSNEEDLFSFASELPEDYFVISARAPKELYNGGYAWFDIQFDIYGNKTTNDQEALVAKQQIIDFIDEIIEKYPIDKENVNLIGFSQGAILSYAIALTVPEKVNKIVALSGYFKENYITDYLPDEAYKDLSFFVSHGTVDQVISIDEARQIAPILEKRNIQYEYHEYPVGHGVSPKNFFDFKAFLERE